MVGWENGDKDEQSASSAENQIPIFFIKLCSKWPVSSFSWLPRPLLRILHTFFNPLSILYLIFSSLSVL
jgi:DUF1365 family protein